MTRAAPRLKVTTKQLMERLHRHYLGTEMFAGGELATEVGINNGQGGGGSRCDAVWVGFTSTWGRVMVGHELKTSRADWLRELNNPFKASWADACHAWMVVAPDTTVAQPQEIPPGWGLMVVDPKRPVKMRIVVKPEVRATDWSPPWWAVRSFMARVNTLRSAEINRIAGLQAERLTARAIESMERRNQAVGQQGMTLESAQKVETMDSFTKAGVNLVSWRHRETQDELSPQDLKNPVVRAILRDSSDADQVLDQLRARWQGLPAVEELVDRLKTVVAKLGQPVTDDGQ